MKHNNCCKRCRHWDPTKETLVVIDGNKTRFRKCINQQIDYAGEHDHKPDVKVITTSLYKNPIMTHARFGCNLFEVR